MHVCITHIQGKRMFARGSKSQTLVRMERGETSHRQFPNFENQGSEEKLMSQKDHRAIYRYIWYIEGDIDTRGGGGWRHLRSTECVKIADLSDF